jgi:fucose permease
MSPSSFRLPFLAGAAAVLALAPAALSIPTHRLVALSAPRSRARPDHTTLLAAFAALFFVLGGIEASLGGWEATQLIAQGATVATAATFTALYWGTFTAGRLLVAPLTLRVGPRRMVIVALLSFTGLAGAALIPSLSPAAYTLAGFCLAPLYPLSLVWFDRILQSGSSTRWVMISDLIGSAALPFIVGQLIALTSPVSLAAALCGCGVVSLGIAAAAPEYAPTDTASPAARGQG